MFDPWEYLRERGIRVEHGRLPAGKTGEWWPDQHIIVIDSRLSARQELSDLSHECGHFALGHTECSDENQRAADSWAADRLVEPRSYRQAEMMYGQNWSAIAEELNVEQWVVKAWRRDETNRNWTGYFNGEMTA